MAEKKVEKTEEKLEDALLKVALGYQLAEVTEEYAEVNGELKLTKRKKTKKDVPPDLKAVQLLLNGNGEEYGGLTDEELQKEKERLLAHLQTAVEETPTVKKETPTVKKETPTVKKKTSTVKKKTPKKTVKRKTVKKGE